MAIDNGINDVHTYSIKLILIIYDVLSDNNIKLDNLEWYQYFVTLQLQLLSTRELKHCNLLMVLKFKRRP